MTITDKEVDRYYLNRFNINKKQYNKAFLWAKENWYNMLPIAQGKDKVSIADQITQACRVPCSAGADIANSISISNSI